MRNYYSIGLSALLLSPSFATTLPHQSLKSYDCQPCNFLSREEIQVNWPMQGTTLTHQVIHEQSSKKYRLQASFAKLQKGIEINTLAQGAVIRIVPQQNHSAIQFQLHKESVNLPLAEASELYAENETLRDTAFADEQQTIVQLKPSLGFGKFLLTATGQNISANDQFIIHVFDKASTTSMSIKTDKSHYVYGDQVIAGIRLADDNTGYPADQIKATLYTADGRDYPLTVEAVGRDSYQAKMTLKDEENPAGGNFYIDAEITTQTNNGTVKREAHTAFSYVIPSAEISEISAVENRPLTFSAIVKTAVASRYALQAVLFATNDKGKPIAVENMQLGHWLTAGETTVYFNFDKQNLQQYHAPFSIGEIRLLDYGQMKPVFEYNTLIPIPITDKNA